jgi:hypothetical protein
MGVRGTASADRRQHPCSWILTRLNTSRPLVSFEVADKVAAVLSKISEENCLTSTLQKKKTIELVKYSDGRLMNCSTNASSAQSYSLQASHHDRRRSSVLD